MKSKSIAGASIEEIQSALAESMTDGFKPTLGLVFISVHQQLDSICSLLNEYNIQIFGATTAGEFIDGQIRHGETVILLLDLNPSYFTILFREHQNDNGRSLAMDMGKESLEHFNHPLFLAVTSGFYLDGEMVIRGIEDAVGKNSAIWGGKAADEQMGQATTVFTNSISSTEGINLLVIDGDKVDIVGQAVSGWKGVGTPKRITKRDGLWIKTLDDIPALDLMIKYMGYRFKKKGDREHTYDASVTSPFLLLRKKGAPILRAQAFINWDEKSMMLTGNCEDDDLIQLTLPPDFEVVDEVVDQSKKLLAKEMPEPDALVMFSCSGRLVELGPLMTSEISGIKEAANTSMAGFFCYGEFGRATEGDNEYHTYTCSWAALKEKT